MFLKVKRFKHLEDLLAEANLIQIGSGEPDVDASEYSPEQLNALKKMDEFLDTLIDQAIKVEAWKEDDIIKSKQHVENYLKYCKNRLERISRLIKDEFAKGGTAHNDLLKSLAKQQAQIAKRISVLDDMYDKLKAREDAQVKQVAEDISRKIEDVQRSLENSYLIIITGAGKANQINLDKIQKAETVEDKEEIAEEIIGDWVVVDEIIEDFPEEDKVEFERAKRYTEDKVKEEIGEDRFRTMSGQSSGFTREEATVLRRILELNIGNFQTEKELETELHNIDIKLNGLKGQTKLRKASHPDTIKYLEDLLTQAKLALREKVRSKSIQVDKTKGIHFDFNKKLRLYERVALPVTGKQIADDSRIMKLRRGLSSLMDLLFGPDNSPMTPAGQAFANFGELIHNIYAKTLNKTAKVIGKALKGREGEMKGDAISRMFIPGPAVLDVKKEAAFEEAGAPGVSPQVPGSIGSMGPITPPTATTLGSGDNFSPMKKKKKKSTHILEFSDFLKQNNNQ